jgi:hypothetical protein
VLDLEHYLDVLGQKPGAFAGSKPLAQWRAAGRWPVCYDELWDRLRARHGKQNGTSAFRCVVIPTKRETRAMVEVIGLGREFGHDALRTAVASTVSLGACDVAAVRYLLTEAGLPGARLCAAIVCFCSVVQRRRRSPRGIKSIRRVRALLRLVVCALSDDAAVSAGFASVSMGRIKHTQP